MLGPGTSESACELFESGLSVTYNTLVLLGINSIGFQSQMFQDLVSMVLVPRVRVPDVGHRPLSPLG